MGFSRQEYWSGLLFSSPKHLPYPGIKLRVPALQVHSSLIEPSGKLHPKSQATPTYPITHGGKLVLYERLDYFDWKNVNFLYSECRNVTLPNKVEDSMQSYPVHFILINLSRKTV